MTTGGRVPIVDAALSTSPPRHLFHYTDSAGLIGICTTKQLWAGRAADMNDSKEQSLLVEWVRLCIRNWLENRPPSDELTVSLLQLMCRAVDSTNRQIYTVSFSTASATLLHNGALIVQGAAELHWGYQQIIFKR